MGAFSLVAEQLFKLGRSWQKMSKPTGIASFKVFFQSHLFFKILMSRWCLNFSFNFWIHLTGVSLQGLLMLLSLEMEIPLFRHSP